MIRTNSFLYEILDSIYKLVKVATTIDVNEVRYFLSEDDISSLSVKDMRFSMLLSESGLERIKTKLNINSATPVVLLFKNNDNELIRLVKALSLKDVLYDDTLIWNAQNDEDLDLQLSMLKRAEKEAYSTISSD